ncbi:MULTISPECIES: hypothetical protein [Sphingomonadaceae]|uniref:Uncharacterized protein n=1 Tax=Sphingobium yanoikuyae TaxID=13690 RepID=A0AA42WSV2_SPHYA|nr:hypothetical protein [Sphingobium yanoikuyae]MDH2129542.1 hypothetical protein [Sphingobium yanoikuyae]MDH2167665.1 hypothetical protein [Sphingobium yanoikuyae]
MPTQKILTAFREFLLRARGAHTRWQRKRQLARHTRKLEAILREEPPYVAEAVDLFFRQKQPVPAIAETLGVDVEEVRDALLRIVEHFEPDVH